MGAAQSTVISPDEFKNYIYGTVILMLSPQLDQQLRFEECSNIKEEDKHVLPLVSTNQNLTMDEMLIEYTQYYGSKQLAIDKYVKEHILDSNDSIMTFIKGLVFHMQSVKRQSSGKSVYKDNSVIPTHTEPPFKHQKEPLFKQQPPQQQQQQPPQQQQEPIFKQQSEVQPIRIIGHNKLQKRLVALGHAVDTEQLAYQQQMQQLNQSYLPVKHNMKDIEEIYADEGTLDGDYENNTYPEDPKLN